MKTFKNLNFGVQLYVGFAAVVSLMLILAAFTISRIGNITEAVRLQNLVQSNKLDLLYVAREALDQTGMAARNAFIFSNNADANRELDLVDKQIAIYEQAMQKMEPVFGADPDFAKVRNGLASMAKELKRPRRYRDAGTMTDYGLFLVNECSPLRRQIVADIDRVLTKVQSEAHQATERVRVEHEQSLLWIIALTVASVALASVIAMVITRGLLRQLGGEPRYATEIANQIAGGDLTTDVRTRTGDSDSLLYAIKVMRDNLSSIVSKVRSGTDHIACASTDIASGNTNLALRTVQQTSSLQEVATAMQQLTTSVRGNAGSAVQASVLASSASDISLQGGAVVGQVVDTMELINTSSKRIADITSVIDSIAFQTNILALNAAVEAARAGEQGRGFAVVATEVRNLAQRSAAAAREIKVLIDDSVSKVAAGVILVERAGNTMHDVVNGITRVSVVIGEISRASEAQSRDIDAIDSAVSRLDNVTGQNATLVEAAATASLSLKEQATELAAAVYIFKLRAASVSKVAKTQSGNRTTSNHKQRLIAAHQPG